MKDKLASTLSHELKTALLIIKESTAQILEGIHGPVNESQKHLLSISLSNIDKITRIVSSL